ncbi:MAG: sel1 repeat family protein [Oscillospiraceae bacterium]|jgi:hypothetical protein|nr:sel1 repeat family protein [Oscillospiraceae bacterium]
MADMGKLLAEGKGTKKWFKVVSLCLVLLAVLIGGVCGTLLLFSLIGGPNQRDTQKLAVIICGGSIVVITVKLIGAIKRAIRQARTKIEVYENGIKGRFLSRSGDALKYAIMPYEDIEDVDYSTKRVCIKNYSGDDVSCYPSNAGMIGIPIVSHGKSSWDTDMGKLLAEGNAKKKWFKVASLFLILLALLYASARLALYVAKNYKAPSISKLYFHSEIVGILFAVILGVLLVVITIKLISAIKRTIREARTKIEVYENGIKGRKVGSGGLMYAAIPYADIEEVRYAADYVWISEKAKDNKYNYFSFRVSNAEVIGKAMVSHGKSSWDTDMGKLLAEGNAKKKLFKEASLFLILLALLYASARLVLYVVKNYKAPSISKLYFHSGFVGILYAALFCVLLVVITIKLVVAIKRTILQARTKIEVYENGIKGRFVIKGSFYWRRLWWYPMHLSKRIIPYEDIKKVDYSSKSVCIKGDYCYPSNAEMIGKAISKCLDRINEEEERKRKEEMRALESLAEQGDANAQCNLGDCYWDGEGIEKDYAKAVHWYLKAVEQGHADAQYKLGLLYHVGLGADKDYAKAVYWYEKAAVQGNSNAQNSLGNCYKNGEGVESDNKKAAYWYEKAAEMGNADAQCNLALSYYMGTGVVQDYAKVVYWAKKAAENGKPDGQFILGHCYYQGFGIVEDVSKAEYWYRRAAAQGHDLARESLQHFFSN